MFTSALLVSINWKNPKQEAHTVDDWVDPDDTTDGYIKSMIIAERHAWDFMENLSDDEKFEFVSLVPSLIVGPSF